MIDWQGLTATQLRAVDRVLSEPTKVAADQALRGAEIRSYRFDK